MDDPDKLIMLVCPPHDVEFVTRAATTGVCSRCFERVIVSPSSRKFMQHSPVEIVCLDCYCKIPDEELDKHSFDLAASDEEFVREIQSVIRNPRARSRSN